MAIRSIRPFNEAHLCCGTTSIATTPVSAQVSCPVQGYVQRVMHSATGTFTGTITTTVKVNGGSDITGGNFTLAPQTGAVAGTVYELSEVGAGTTSGVYVNEGDTIVFAPSGGTGSTIGGAFTIVIRTTD